MLMFYVVVVFADDQIQPYFVLLSVLRRSGLSLLESAQQVGGAPLTESHRMAGQYAKAAAPLFVLLNTFGVKLQNEFLQRSGLATTTDAEGADAEEFGQQIKLTMIGILAAVVFWMMMIQLRLPTEQNQLEIRKIKKNIQQVEKHIDETNKRIGKVEDDIQSAKANVQSNDLTLSTLSTLLPLTGLGASTISPLVEIANGGWSAVLRQVSNVMVAGAVACSTLVLWKYKVDKLRQMQAKWSWPDKLWLWIAAAGFCTSWIVCDLTEFDAIPLVSSATNAPQLVAMVYMCELFCTAFPNVFIETLVFSLLSVVVSDMQVSPRARSISSQVWFGVVRFGLGLMNVVLASAMAHTANNLQGIAEDVEKLTQRFKEKQDHLTAKEIILKERRDTLSSVQVEDDSGVAKIITTVSGAGGAIFAVLVNAPAVPVMAATAMLGGSAYWMWRR
jgi:hypothetical protein